MRLLKINKIYSMFIPPGTSLLNANVYFINDEIKTIIDTGIPFTLTLDRLKHILKILNMKRIDRVIITHCHIDHYANAGFLQKHFDCEIFAHVNSIPILSKKNRSFNYQDFEYLEFIETSFPFLNKKRMEHPIIKNFINFVYKFYHGNTIPVHDITKLKHGSSISCGKTTLNVIYTPGHSDDSICLYDPNLKIIFTGDTIPFTPYIHTSISDIKKSVKSIISLDINYAFRGHCHFPHRWSHELPLYLDFLDSMKIAQLRILIALKKKGPLSLSKIVPLMYERTHAAHTTLYRIMHIDHIWALKYLQHLQKLGLVDLDNNKYFLKNH